MVAAAFIRFHNLNTDEILDHIDSFRSFNQFFYRKLRPGARVVEAPGDPTVAVSPADSRMLAFATVDDATRYRFLKSLKGGRRPWRAQPRAE